MPTYPGNILTANKGSVNVLGSSNTSWTWLRNSVAIAGQTASTYVVTESDIDSMISLIQRESNPLGSASRTSASMSISAYFPLLLFASGEPGLLLEPSDPSTIFQDVAGTQPVTAPGQTVALVLDKSRGAGYSGGQFTGLGPELIANGGFDDATGWTAGAGWTIADGSASWSAATGASLSRALNAPMVAGRAYRVTLDLAYTSGAGVQIGFNGGGGIDLGPTLQAPSGIRQFVVFATLPRTGIAITGIGNSVLSVDNVSVRELPGNHATQSTPASRPTYGVHPITGVRNELTWTEQFDNAAWTNSIGGTGLTPTRTANFAAAPDGSMTADRIQFNLNGGTTVSDISRLSILHEPLVAGVVYTVSFWARLNTGSSATINVQETSFPPSQLTVTDQWQRVSFSGTASSAGTSLLFGLRGGQTPTNSNTVDLLVWGAQLERGSTATAYQRVTTRANITEAGVPGVGHLLFDGADDFLVTPTITPGTDKVQVWAGVRKLSDSARRTVIELSGSVAANNGGFHMTAPDAASATYAFESKGTSLANASASGFAAPNSAVLTGLGDISGDSTILRVNGTQVAQSTADQGTGNYLAYQAFIGRRGGTSNPFNGRIYALIVRFGVPQSDLLLPTERYINNITRAY